MPFQVSSVAYSEVYATSTADPHSGQYAGGILVDPVRGLLALGDGVEGAHLQEVVACRPGAVA